MRADMAGIIQAAPQNLAIQNALFRMDMNLDLCQNPVCSVSGGSDSDTMMDLIERVRGDRPMTYVFFDTGIEYAATHRHLDALQQKYGVEILRRKAAVPVPLGCKTYGLPFLSKEASQFIRKLQAHGFRWEDKPAEALLAEYPNAKAGVGWWCNSRGEEYGIGQYRYLKEFMMQNPPRFAISDKCCNGAKKNPAGRFYTAHKSDLKILGLRLVEGGLRATSIESCFSPATDDSIAAYRPLWFWSDADKAAYKAHYGMTYSDCYEIWGFKRTGCAGCPFNSRFEDDLLTMQRYEPKLYQAANSIFGASYDYTRAYRQYRDRRKAMDRESVRGQIGWEDVV